MTLWLLAALICGEPRSPLTAIAVSPDRKSVVVGSAHGLAAADPRAASAPGFRPHPLEIAGLPPAIHDIAFHRDGTRVAVVGGEPAQSGRVVVLSWPEQKPVGRFEVGEDVLFDVAWHGDELLLASLDGTAWLMSVTGEPLAQYSGHSRGVTSIAAVTEAIVATGSLDSTVRVWDRRSGQLVRTLSQHGRPITGLAVRPQSEGPVVLASISGDRTVRFWHPQTGRMLRFARVPSPAGAIAWVSPVQVALACHDGSVRFIDFETVETLREESIANGPLHAIAVGQKDRLLIGRFDGVLASLRIER